MLAPPPDPRPDAARALWEQGRAAWPGLDLPFEHFFVWLLPRLEPGRDPARLVAPDLFLACACLLGVPGAADSFVARYQEANVRQARQVAGDTDAAELVQEAAVRLLVPGPDGSPPRLAQYSGRGPLSAWLRMTLLRRALNLRRDQRPSADLGDLPDLVSAHDVELSAVRRRYGHQMREIFAEAAAATPADERMLLRMHYALGSTLDELALVFRTSRSSVHRRIEAARAQMLTRIADGVRTRLGIDTQDRASLLRVFQSDLRETLAVVLREP